HSRSGTFPPYIPIRSGPLAPLLFRRSIAVYKNRNGPTVHPWRDTHICYFPIRYENLGPPRSWSVSSLRRNGQDCPGFEIHCKGREVLLPGRLPGTWVVTEGHGPSVCDRLRTIRNGRIALGPLLHRKLRHRSEA